MMMLNNPEFNDERSFADLPAGSGLGHGGGAGDWSTPFTGGRDFLDDSDTFGSSPFDFGSEVDLGDSEGYLEGPYDAFEAFNQAAQSHLSNAKAKGRPKALENVTPEDFLEGAPRNAFLVVMHFANKLLRETSPVPDVLDAVKFFFQDASAEDALSFDLCMAVLGVRADVVRLRIQYEWWLRGTTFTGPFNFTSTPLPDLLRGEVLYRGNLVGCSIAAEIWQQPGVSTDELCEVMAASGMGAQTVVQTLEGLQEAYLISKSSGWYFTGRNPVLMNMNAPNAFNAQYERGGSVHWTRLFGH